MALAENIPYTPSPQLKYKEITPSPSTMREWLQPTKDVLKWFQQWFERGMSSDVIWFLDAALKQKWSHDQNTFFIATKWENEQKYTRLELKKIGDKVFSYTSPTNQKFQITFREWVGVNQQFSAALPAGHRIYGLSFPVSSEYAGTYKTSMPYSFVSYVPYEPLLDTPEKRSKWLDYLKTGFRQAHEKIKTANIPSQAFPGKKVHEVIPYWLPMMFNIVEHMDNDIYIGSQAKWLLKPKDEVLNLMGDKMGEVLYQYANNGRATYNYSLSRDKRGNPIALGSAQMKQKPYDTLGKEFYPHAHLNPDFIAGMQDHTNAMMAQILWFDNVIQTFPSAFKQNYLLYIQWKPQKTDIVGMLWASYNKGTSISRDLKAGEKWKDIFKDLPIESQIYFHKTRYVRQELGQKYGMKEIPESPNTAKVSLKFQDPKLIEWANRRTGKKKSGKTEGKLTELERERREMAMRKPFRTYSDIADGIKESKLIFVPESGKGYELVAIGMYEENPSKKNLLRVLDPPTRRLLEEIAGKFDLNFPGKKLPITSLARPQEYYDKIPSQGNHKANDGKTSHMHGLSFDIGISRMRPEERKWLNIELKGLKDKKVIFTALEGKNAMHVFLRPVDNVRSEDEKSTKLAKTPR